MPIELHRTLSRQSWRRRIERLGERPFGRLVAHFLDRMVRGGRDEPSTEFEMGAGSLLGLLAAPGAFTSFVLIDKYSTLLDFIRGRRHPDLYLTSLPDKYMFLCLAMAVAGIVTILKWDRILPDSQDYLNLAPLPLRSRSILLANAAAIVIAVVVIAIDVNTIPALLFPMFVTEAAGTSVAGSLQFVAVHALSVALATVFTIFALFALMGTLSGLLPRGVFRACSAWVRGAVLLALLSVLAAAFAGQSLVREFERHPDSLLRFFPPLWYLALYQDLQHRASPSLAKLAPWAWNAAVAAFAWTAVAYALSYHRRFRAVLESAKRPAEQKFVGVLLAGLDLFAPRATGFPRACQRFVIRALLRNENHRFLLAVSLGMGWLLAFGAMPDIKAPLMAGYLLTLGLRLAFDLPAGASSGWIFRAVLDPRANETPAVARRIILSFVTPLVILPWLAIAWWRLGFGAALVETLFLFAAMICAGELLLRGYRKIPLTCPVPALRENVLMMVLMHLLGFGVFSALGAGAGRWVLASPVRLIWIPPAMGIAWLWKQKNLREAREAGELEEGLTFENVPIRTVERLNLSGG